MPLRIKDIQEYGLPIGFLENGEIKVRTGPCSSAFWDGKKIPLDGRFYICSGTIILKNGLKLRANFEINTHTFDFLEQDTVKIYIDKNKAWYYMNEKELYDLIGVLIDDALPYTWLPDRELDYSKQGPYPMNWPIIEIK